MSDSLQPHGLQHTRLPCPSPTPGACSNSCASSRWCHATVLSSAIPFSSAFNLSQHQGLFQWVSPLHQVAKVLELQLQDQFFQWIFRTDFLEDWLVWPPCSPRDSQESSPTPQSESVSSLADKRRLGGVLMLIQRLFSFTLLFRVKMLSIPNVNISRRAAWSTVADHKDRLGLDLKSPLPGCVALGLCGLGPVTNLSELQ